MILIVLFAFIAGIVTILSPCILPILPIVLSSTVGGQNTGKSRPYGVVLGFILSFSFFTLFLSTVVKATGISSNSLRGLSIVIIAFFGLSLIIPQFQLLVDRLFTKLSRFTPRETPKSGFIPGLLIGFSLGLLWTPCVGPILASVISLALSGTITANAVLITFAYSLGTAIPLFFIINGGQNILKKTPWLIKRTGFIQKTFGVIMVLTAIGIYANVDRTFQTYVLTTFPQYGSGLTQFEKLALPSPIASFSKAPSIIPGGEWFNTKPLTLAELKGKVVIVDFWTYTCINCQRTLPYLQSWWSKYKDKGLVVIGVHSPEFEFEKDANNLSKAIKDFGLTYPIVQDNDFSTWRAYNNQYWPAKYIIDSNGNIRFTHFGEGNYDETEKDIQDLLKESGVQNVSSKINNPVSQTYGLTPETYVGASRIAHFSSPESIQNNSYVNYTSANSLQNDTFAFSGKWNITDEYAIPQKGSVLNFNFNAKEVYLVMKVPNHPSKVKVFVDGKAQYFGMDVINGTIIVDSDRLYKLVLLPTPGRHMLKLEFQDTDVQLFAFTFG